MFKVVIAEDEKVIRKGLAAIVNDLISDFEVVGEADHGDRALELLAYDCPDVLLTDIRMPRRDGLSLIKEARAHYPQLAIVIVSGHEEFAYAQQAIQFGVARYLLKPIDRTEVVLAFDEIKRDLGGDVQEGNQPICQVDAYIKRKIDQDITLSDVAQLVHLHPTYFSQWFKNETGQNFSTYVTAKRLQRAERLLKETNLRVYEVARMAGYQSEKHFMKIFKKENGCTLPSSGNPHQCEHEMKGGAAVVLRHKIILLFLAIVLLPLNLLGMLTYSYFSKTLEDQTYHYTVQVIDQVNQNINAYIEEMHRLSLLPLYDRDILAILQERAEHQEGYYPHTEELERMSSFLSTLSYNRQELSGIHIITSDGSLFSNLGSPRTVQRLSDEPIEWKQLIQAGEGRSLLLATHAPSYFLDGKEPVFFSGTLAT